MIVASLGVGSALALPALADCGDAKTSIVSCQADGKSKTAEDSAIWKVLVWVLGIMTAGVGILAVGGITYGAILYASASDKAEQTKKGISIISNTVIGLVAYGLMYVLLNFLIPGGIFK